jgi:DNA phosphorothioation-associated DGQHR protein 1
MEEMNRHFPFDCPGLFLSQPFGEFFVASIPARILLEVAYSDRLTAEKLSRGTYRVSGSQRASSERRFQEIGQFIDSPTAAFPNSIILAANYRADNGLIEEDESRKWTLAIDEGAITGRLSIPTDAKLAPIIDGQHRLFGFEFAVEQARLNMPLLCSVFFDLPKPYQAFLFATINSNQRPVSKSLTYELFGYNVEDESPEKWTPEKLAVFLTRKLATDAESPFQNHIIIAAENDFAPKIAQVRRERGWAISTATVVEGILKLISSNPKRDANSMGGSVTYEGKNRSTLTNFPDASPLRPLYISKSDDLIYTGVNNFFTAVDRILWHDIKPDSYIRKTVGVQALFDVGRNLIDQMVAEKDFRIVQFEKRVEPARKIDFADRFFQSSGTGRQRIRNILELCIGLKTIGDVSSDQQDYQRLLQ